MPASFAQFEQVDRFRPNCFATALTLPTFRNRVRNSSTTAGE
ncbi:hypothetical protein ACQCSV_18275 [Pseudarthrobacter sp. S3]